MKKLFFIICFAMVTYMQVEAFTERRAAIDVGSGGTKLTIADIDSETNQIVEVLLDISIPVPYQASLDQSENGTFDAEVRDLGLRSFREIKELTESYQVHKIAAIATSAFRKANNNKEFVTEIEESTGIHVKVILQREEGEIAFYSALAGGQITADEAIVWDIGTGSMQITTPTCPEGSLAVYMGEQMGSVAFRNYIISVVQDKDLQHYTSPNPMTEEDLIAADSYVREFGRRAYPLIKDRIKEQEGSVFGIGRLFNHSIRPVASDGEVITRSALRRFIRESLHKTDEELNNPFANVDVSNCILTLAIMKALHIHEIRLIETTTTRGLLASPTYWDITPFETVWPLPVTEEGDQTQSSPAFSADSSRDSGGDSR